MMGWKKFKDIFGKSTNLNIFVVLFQRNDIPTDNGDYGCWKNNFLEFICVFRD